MVRTRADAVTTRVAGAKAMRKIPAGAANHQTAVNSNGEKTNRGGGGNSYFPRETPDWQKPITSFFIRPAGESEEGSSTKSDGKMDLIKDDSHSSAGPSTSKQDTTD